MLVCSWLTNAAPLCHANGDVLLESCRLVLKLSLEKALFFLVLMEQSINAWQELLTCVLSMPMVMFWKETFLGPT